MENEIKQIIIVGGGIGGLCAAIALRQIGIGVKVYEQAEKLEAVGAGLTLWANAIKALRKLSVADEVIKTGAKIERAELRTANGRVLSRSAHDEFERLFGEPTIAIHRADLHDILRSALPADVVQLSARCSRVEQNESQAIVHFADSRSDQADLVVGADGIHSVIRTQLFPEVRLRYSGYASWRGVVQTTDEAALGVTSETWGRGSRFGILRIDENQVYWFTTANVPAGQTQTAPERKEFLLHRFKGWHHPIELLIRSTPAEAILRNDIYDLKSLSEWSEGRVCLLGDAAHPTTPNLGQGACMAIESAVVLARSLSQEESFTLALERYERERKPRTAWITNQSWKIGQLGQIENPLLCSARDFVTRILPSEISKRPFKRAVGFDL
jgi:FAD-dependent urate hydroxylase